MNCDDELWRDSARWLIQWDVLRSDHRINWPNAGIVDLANTLRDGVLLCTLISKIDPECIDMKDVNLKPAMAQFLCLRNIEVFLKVCGGTFGLKKSDLFDPLMLFELSNFHKVLCTISKLSASSKAIKSNIKGFSAQSYKSREDEDIYQSLVESVEPPARTALNAVVYEEYCDYNRGEEIYQELCSLQKESPSEFVGFHPPLEKRDYVINELVETEHNYVEVINKLMKNFMKPLQGYLKPEYHACIFCKISELQEIHTGFLSQLLKVGPDRTVRLSNIFISWSERFLVYGTYCANLSNACAVLQEQCSKDELLNQAIIKCEKEYNNGKFKLRDVLKVPMQRILKYPLLLEKLIESTDRNHEKFLELKNACEIMIDVAGFINEAVADSEHLDRIKKVHENIIEWDASSESKLESFGRFIKDADLKIKAHDDKKTRNRYAFIFDKVMILCKPLKGKQYAFRDLLQLPEYRIDNFNNRPALNDLRWSYSYHWSLVKYDQTSAYTFSARTIQIKEKMIKALKDAVENVRPATLLKTSHKVEMHTFDKPTTCNRCSKYLKGLIFQGYKCKICNVAVHKECIATSGKCDLLSDTQQLSIHNDSHLVNKLWFVGEMDRNGASAALKKRRNGTFLVRMRSANDDHDRFSLSLKTDNTVKHMKIYWSLMGSEEKYYLSHYKYFNSIGELIENYQKFSLRENFERLEEHTKLESPYQSLRGLAIRDFKPQNSEHISFHEGQEIVVISQEGYRDGWWKGKCDQRIGYFPSSYVHPIDITTQEIL